jgi:hypothetical protein
MSPNEDSQVEIAKLLNLQKLGQALKTWRERKNIRPNDVVQKSQVASKKPVTPSTISLLEKNGTGVAYNALIKNVFPAYGITDICDLDLFLGYCATHSVKTVSVVRARDRDVRNNKEGTKEILISPERLKGNRVRISIIEIMPNGRTVWQNHDGFEYVMVGKGKVVAEFADTSDTPEDKRTKFELNEEDGVAFSSLVHHSFINNEKETAQLIIARPTKSLPKGMFYSEA